MFCCIFCVHDYETITPICNIPLQIPISIIHFFFFFCTKSSPHSYRQSPVYILPVYVFLCPTFHKRNHTTYGLLWLASFFFYIFYFYLLIWLFLVVSCKIFDLHCSTWTLGCSLWDIILWPGIEPRSPVLGPSGKSLVFFHLERFSRFNHIVADISTLFPLMME